MRGSFASFVVLAVATHHVAAVNLTDFVNLFVGTATANGGSGGNSFPGMNGLRAHFSKIASTLP